MIRPALAIVVLTTLALAGLVPPSSAFVDVVCTTTTGCPGSAAFEEACIMALRVVESASATCVTPIGCTAAGSWGVRGEAFVDLNVKFWATCSETTVAECLTGGRGSCDSGLQGSGEGRGGCWMTARSSEGRGECYDPVDPCRVMLALPADVRPTVEAHVRVVDVVCADGATP